MDTMLRDASLMLGTRKQRIQFKGLLREQRPMKSPMGPTASCGQQPVGIKIQLA
jgi:hypothetical protein